MLNLSKIVKLLKRAKFFKFQQNPQKKNLYPIKITTIPQ